MTHTWMDGPSTHRRLLWSKSPWQHRLGQARAWFTDPPPEAGAVLRAWGAVGTIPVGKELAAGVGVRNAPPSLSYTASISKEHTASSRWTLILSTHHSRGPPLPGSGAQEIGLMPAMELPGSAGHTRVLGAVEGAQPAVPGHTGQTYCWAS